VGTFRDEEGEIYCPVRRIPAGLSGAARDTRHRVFLRSTLDHPDGMHMHPVGRDSVPNDNCRRTLEATAFTSRVVRQLEEHGADPNAFYKPA
jgi:hypothetical protein